MFCCPDVSGQVVPPLRSQDSKQSGCSRVISAKWRSHKSISWCRAEWTYRGVRPDQIPDVDGTRTVHSTVRKDQCFEADAGGHRYPVKRAEERSGGGEFRLKTSRAAAFWMSCRGRMALAGRPAGGSCSSLGVKWPEPGPEPGPPPESEEDVFSWCCAACTYRNVLSQ